MQAIDSLIELEDAFRRSTAHPVLVFKHSASCPVSAMALREYEAVIAHQPPDSILIVVQDQPGLSTEVAKRTGVEHQTPQALILVDGEAVFAASHWQVRAETIEAELAQLDA